MIANGVWLFDDVELGRCFVWFSQRKQEGTLRMYVATFPAGLGPGHVTESTTDFSAGTLKTN